MRPLWDYPPGVRAPGEGVAPSEPGSVGTADAINAYVQAEAMFADPLGMARAASAALDPANVSAIVASGHAAPATDAPETRVVTALLVDDTPHQAIAQTPDNPESSIGSANTTTTPTLKQNDIFRISTKITKNVDSVPSDAVLYTDPDGTNF
jgi:hypothetical protein